DGSGATPGVSAADPSETAAARHPAPSPAPEQGRSRNESASWADAPPPSDTAPSWASPYERAKAEVAVEAPPTQERPVVDDEAISADDESIDDLTDVGVPVIERILGGTVIADDSR
ncbi:MAG: hypothetical protein WBL35_10050, partial [Ornithinibacter sp.]